jgi:hypothetical protein
VGLVVAGEGKALRSSGFPGDPIAIPLEPGSQATGYSRIVFDEQDVILSSFHLATRECPLGPDIVPWTQRVDKEEGRPDGIPDGIGNFSCGSISGSGAVSADCSCLSWHEKPTVVALWLSV